MNEKIKLLAEQAGYEDLPTVRLAFHGFNKEKFAQLIAADILGCYDAIDNGNRVEGTEDFVKAVVKRYNLGEKK